MALILRADDMGTVRLEQADDSWQRGLGSTPHGGAGRSATGSRRQEASEAGWAGQVEIGCCKPSLLSGTSPAFAQIKRNLAGMIDSVVTVIEKGLLLKEQRPEANWEGKLYGNVPFIEERHRHRYEVNPNLINKFEQNDLNFVGQDVSGERMEIIELANHPYFVGVQFHPEFSSRPMKPSPPYLGLLLAATGNLNAYLQQGCTLSASFISPEGDPLSIAMASVLPASSEMNTSKVWESPVDTIQL
ncbi:CTP synthase 2 [Tupaia chinensis]|uniref:CTP synthase (glutamine hydrolyzing) n=1 Tax=Tupaia chinensis TaxID=246437 RepID=L9JDQ8_TUPCH|nr:CTP synthase 2 [Tupaia chinensis]